MTASNLRVYHINMKPEGLISILNKPYTKELKAFLGQEETKTGLCYLRGRRRVGKSTLLKSMQQRVPLFYFSGKLDEPTSICMWRFSQEWATFSKNNLLKNIKKSNLSWELLFNEVIKHARSQRTLIAFDEIQWLAKAKNGFIGTIKNLWPEMESTQNILMVICGSSNKFFKDFTGGEEQILRGLKTRSDIIVQPFTLSDVHKYYFPNFKLEEILFIYMLIGGIPYYLNQLPKGENFIQTINSAFFTKESIFYEEIDEILRLEFNAAGLITIKKILNTLGIKGRGLNEILTKSKLAVGTVVESLEKLVEYGIVFEKKPLYSKSLEIKRGVKYQLKDFFINTYFQILKPNLRKIKLNTEGSLLINSIFKWPQSFYYVENFSGESFENLIEFILNSSESRHENIFKKLKLKNTTFIIEGHWDKQVQIDLIVTDTEDQQDRLLECKWTSSIEIIKEAIQQLPEKEKRLNLTKEPILSVVIPIKSTPTLEMLAKKNQVTLITQEDLF